ncbi:hypothetical protein C6A85_04070, partial [Mycobacterium sp. ITM-2017-0098]
MLLGDVVVGHAGQLHPSVVERSGLPKGTCAVEIDLDVVRDDQRDVLEHRREGRNRRRGKSFRQRHDVE